MASTSLAVPPLLAPGARVALIAPAGPLAGEHELALAAEQARALGWEPAVGEHALARHGYFAGTDAERLRDLNRAIEDRQIDGVWCLRGGYGAMRLLDGIAWDALRRHPKPIIGFSDITAVHSAVNAQCRIVSYHGPTARSPLAAFSRRSLVEAVVAGGDPFGVAAEARVLQGGRATGRLAGGNLALVAGLCGTRYATDLAGAIVVLEDINEPVYRVDRMLQQLLLGGGLRDCAGLVLGAFNNMPDGGSDDGRTLDAVFAEVAVALGVPCIRNVPVGHIDEQWTVPMGRVAELDADGCTMRLL